MRKFIAVAAIVLGMTLLASAQDVPAVEIFGGYSLFHFDKQDADSLATGAGVPAGAFTINQNLHGWEGAVQFNLNKWFGVVGDISGHYGTPVEVAGVGSVKANTYNYLFGPQINVRGGKAKGFVHALLGGNHIGAHTEPAGFSASDNAFAFAIGGGVDYNATKTIGIRLGQFDYVYTNHDFGLGHQNNFRFSAGVVLNLGSKK